MSVEEPTTGHHYRLLLAAELAERKRRNPAYSLRAFATQLDVSAASLSQIMSGKRHLTAKTARRMAVRLGLPPERARDFLASVPRPSLVEGVGGARAPRAPLDRDVLEAETFEIISDWHH